MIPSDMEGYLNRDTRVADFLAEVQSLLPDGWPCFVDINKRVNRDYCDMVGMPYGAAQFEVRTVISALTVDDWYSGPNPDKNRKSNDHFYEFHGLHDGRKVFLRFKIDRDRRKIYVNSFHDDQPRLY